MALADALVNAALMAAVAFGVVIVLVVLRFAVAYINAPEDRSRSEFEIATDVTGRWVGGLIGGAAAAGALGLVQFADIVGIFTMFVGQHPFAVTNAGIAGIGAAAIGGIVALSVEQYIGIALAIMGGTFVLSEVFD